MTNLKLPQTLCQSAQNGRLIPLVGSGISMEVRRTDGTKAFRSRTELLSDVIGHLEDESQFERARAIRAFLDMPKRDYSFLVERAREWFAPDHWRQFLRDRLDPSRTDIVDDSLATAEALWKLGSKLVVTINSDAVLSWACPFDDLRKWPILDEDGLDDLLVGRLNRPCLWQLHGSIEHPSRVLLAPDGNLDKQPPQYRDAIARLRDLSATRPLLFVGFGLDDEYQFEWVRNTFDGGSRHYMFVREDELPRVREKLDGTEIHAIPIADVVEAVERLLRPSVDFAVDSESLERSTQSEFAKPQIRVDSSNGMASASPEPVRDDAPTSSAKDSSGPLEFLFDLVIELLIGAYVIASTWKMLLAFPAILGLFWMNLWLGLHAWELLSKAESTAADIIYVIGSVVLVMPLSIHFMLRRNPSLRAEGAVAATLSFVATALGALAFPNFMIGLGGLRSREPKGLFGATEIVLLVALFLYWGHLSWWSMWGSPLLEAPLLAAATYLSPPALFLVGLWWVPLGSWVEPTPFSAEGDEQSPPQQLVQPGSPGTDGESDL